MNLTLHFVLLALSSPSPSVLPTAVQQVRDFELADLEGNLHRLRDQRGRLVVLEWTSHLCPSVAGATETQRLADTRMAVEALARSAGQAEDVVWWQVDSSWFAPELVGDIGAWRRRSGFEGPLLVDGTGEVGRAFRVLATPQLVVVDTEGKTAYSGPLDTEDGEVERVNHVLETVRALFADKPAPVSSAQLRGCTIKFQRPPGMSASDWGVSQKAEAAYRQATREVAESPTAAYESFERALSAGLRDPWRALTDPTFRPLLADAESRARLHELLRAHPARSSMAMVAADEPGQPLVLAGRVVDGAGAPIPGALISVYHTDDAGWYSPGSLEGENARLFAYLVTGIDGRFRVRTIVPGHYSGRGGPAHIHVKVAAEGFRLPPGQRTSIFFADDVNLSATSRKRLVDDGYPVLDTTRNPEGVALLIHDVRLELE